MITRVWPLAAAVLAVGILAGPAQAATREDVISRGYLQCGVSTGLPGFSYPDEKGNWTGFDVDLCRAVAAAVLGDASKVRYMPLTALERFTALQSGDVDLLSNSTTWTFTRDTSLGLNFTGISYHDGQGFMVPKSLNVASAVKLDGAAVCLQSGTTAELTLADYFKQNGMTYKPVIFDTPNQTLKAFEAGRCEVMTGDRSQLYGLRMQLAEPEEAVVLNEVISKEPMGPVVRQGDDAWFNIVRWTLYALIDGEDLGLTSVNVNARRTSEDSAIKRFLGIEGIKGEGLGLSDDWAYQIIRQVGNYGEVFERTIGRRSPLNIDRGQNRLWSDGGLLYAPPIR